MANFISVKKVTNVDRYDTVDAMINISKIASIEDRGRGLSSIRIGSDGSYENWTVGHDVSEIHKKISEGSK